MTVKRLGTACLPFLSILQYFSNYESTAYSAIYSTAVTVKTVICRSLPNLVEFMAARGRTVSASTKRRFLEDCRHSHVVYVRSVR
jgi:hypothetical protein